MSKKCVRETEREAEREVKANATRRQEEQEEGADDAALAAAARARAAAARARREGGGRSRKSFPPACSIVPEALAPLEGEEKIVAVAVADAEEPVPPPSAPAPPSLPIIVDLRVGDGSPRRCCSRCSRSILSASAVASALASPSASHVSQAEPDATDPRKSRIRYGREREEPPPEAPPPPPPLAVAAAAPPRAHATESAPAPTPAEGAFRAEPV